MSQNEPLIARSKEQWRQACQGVLPASDGRMAEALRRLEAYRQSRQVFVEPTPALTQFRINVLLDHKELIVPGPGLRDGFYLLRPFAVPFPKLPFAVSLKGIPVHGRLITHEELPRLAIGIMVVEALAVDGRGVRLGDGSGFFDLACAILHGCGALDDNVSCVAAAVGQHLGELPCDPWDVRLHGVLGQEGIFTPFSHHDPLPGIDWQHLPMQRVKKITPLWQEWKRLNPLSVRQG